MFSVVPSTCSPFCSTTWQRERDARESRAPTRVHTQHRASERRTANYFAKPDSSIVTELPKGSLRFSSLFRLPNNIRVFSESMIFNASSITLQVFPLPGGPYKMRFFSCDCIIWLPFCSESKWTSYFMGVSMLQPKSLWYTFPSLPFPSFLPYSKFIFWFYRRTMTRSCQWSLLVDTTYSLSSTNIPAT